MRIILTTAFIWVATLAHGQQDGIRATIDAQIEAFASGDLSQAFTYASPSIKTFFGTPERFETMVRSGYPMVVGPDAVQDVELKEMRGAYWQRVLFRDGAGRSHLLEYQMIQVDGEWRINGVRPVPLGPSA